MSDDDLENRLRTWLERQGYPLEMQVANSFARAGFRVIQSEYYSDPRTNTLREVDVYASLQRDIVRTFFRLAMFIECKAGKSKPWVVFVSQKGMADRARVSQRCSNMMGTFWLLEVSLRKDVSDLSIFRLPTAPGYGITAAFTDGVDVPYAAIMSAAAAADSEAQAGDTSGQGLFFSVHFPVVVTEAPLFVCALGSDHSPKIERVEKTVLAWRNPVYRYPHCIVHVVQAAAIDAFVEQTRADFEFLLQETESEMKRVLQNPSFKRAANRRPKNERKSRRVVGKRPRRR
jgi:hypothetical protein